MACFGTDFLQTNTILATAEPTEVHEHFLFLLQALSMPCHPTRPQQRTRSELNSWLPSRPNSSFHPCGLQTELVAAWSGEKLPLSASHVGGQTLGSHAYRIGRGVACGLAQFQLERLSCRAWWGLPYTGPKRDNFPRPICRPVRSDGEGRIHPSPASSFIAAAVCNRRQTVSRKPGRE
jgi:hypothetical protein